MKTLLAIVLIALLVGCSTNAPVRSEVVLPTASLTDEQSEICEAVFRYQFQHNASSQQRRAPAYFLKLFGADPSDAFIGRFAGIHPPVKKASAFKLRGLLFSIIAIEMIGTDAAQVSGGYWEGPLSSSGNIYYVRRKDGKWVCERDYMYMISKGRESNPSIQRPAASRLAQSQIQPRRRLVPAADAQRSAEENA